MKELYLEERRQEILRQVQKEGRVSVSELSQQFGVSEVTHSRRPTGAGRIQPARAHPRWRRAHRARAARTFVITATATASVGEESVSAKRLRSWWPMAMRYSLTPAAPRWQSPNGFKQHHHLTVITNSLAIAQEMLDAPGVNVFMPGGQLRRETALVNRPRWVGDVAQIQHSEGLFWRARLECARRADRCKRRGSRGENAPWLPCAGRSSPYWTPPSGAGWAWQASPR